MIVRRRLTLLLVVLVIAAAATEQMTGELRKQLTIGQQDTVREEEENVNAHTIRQSLYSIFVYRLDSSPSIYYRRYFEIRCTYTQLLQLRSVCARAHPIGQWVGQTTRAKMYGF